MRIGPTAGVWREKGPSPLHLLRRQQGRPQLRRWATRAQYCRMLSSVSSTPMRNRTRSSISSTVEKHSSVCFKVLMSCAESLRPTWAVLRLTLANRHEP